MEILYGIIGLLSVVLIGSLWSIRNLKQKLNTPNVSNESIPSLGGLTPQQVADRVVNRMARAKLDPKATRYALDKVKARFPDIIKTDEQADALIDAALLKAKKLKAA